MGAPFSFHVILPPDTCVTQSYHGKVPDWERMPVDYKISIGYNFLHMDDLPPEWFQCLKSRQVLQVIIGKGARWFSYFRKFKIY